MNFLVMKFLDIFPRIHCLMALFLAPMGVPTGLRVWGATGAASVLAAQRAMPPRLAQGFGLACSGLCLAGLELDLA